MEWVKSLLPLVQTGLRMYVGGRLVQKTSANAKAVALRSGIFAFGAATFLVFLLAAIVMTFIDLGGQFESRDALHFSGMMVSASCLTVLGVFVLLLCWMTTRFLAMREKERKELEVSHDPSEKLLIFAEQFLETLARNLTEKPGQSSHKT